MEENILINADVVNAAINGVSAGIAESTETAPGTTTTSIKDISVSKPKRSLFDYVKIGLAAYGASLIIFLFIGPIIVSAVTAGLYFSLASSLTTPTMYPIVYGAVFTYIAWCIVALFISYLATAKGHNPHSYGLLTTRLRQLEAQLKDIDSRGLDGKARQLAEYQLVALREAREHFTDLERLLYMSPAGLQWVFGSGYINAWEKLHRAEEALIEVEPVEVVLRGALHDKLAIQDSQLSSRDELLKKLRQSVKELNPAIESRFRTYRAEEDNEEIQKLKKHIKQIAAKAGIDLDDDLSDKSAEHQIISTEAEARARLTLREVRQTLNDFRDRLWEGFLRVRNQLAGAIFVAGLVTHFLLIIFILSNPAARNGMMAATVFYIVGAVMGLFERIYRESRMSKAFDDYGLTVVRLIANLLLSGLAGIGGVLLFSAFLSGTIMSNPNTPPTFANIFILDQPEFIIAAAFFGLAPNLIIRSLQQKSEKYISALKSSKGAVEETSDNEN